MHAQERRDTATTQARGRRRIQRPSVASGNVTMDSAALTGQIAAWADSPAEHANAAEALAKWGERAMPGLISYLHRGPQIIPQSRCFVVAMLARLHVPAATAGLREVLHENPLASLSAGLAESEYVVKSDAMDALCARGDAASAEDVAFGVQERLRTAVVAAGRMHLTELAPRLVDLLDDDVSAEAAMESLAALGSGVSAAIVPRLDAWLTEATLSARRRLGLIRALRVLHRVGGAETAALRRALKDSHPAVRAAAALLVWPERGDAAIVGALLHGALGFDRGLAEDCREALTHTSQASDGPAEQALQRNAEPDLYGDIRPLASEQHDWLVGWLRRCRAPRM